MDDLDSRMQRVLDAAREGMNPRTADTERTRRLLLSATAGLAVGVGTSSAAAGASAAGAAGASLASTGKAGVLAAISSLSLGTKIVTAMAVSTAIGGAGIWAVRAPLPVEIPAAPIAVPAKAALAPAPIVAPPPQASPSPALATREAMEPAIAALKTPRAAATPSKNLAPDPLTAELALIERARQALRNDNPKQALVALDDHRARFEHGVMEQERTALRALALCSLGDPRGSAQAKQFLEQHPGSPLSAHLRAGCR